MNKIYAKRLERATNPRMRKRNEKRPQMVVQPSQSRFGAALGEIAESFAEASERPAHIGWDKYEIARAGVDAAMAPLVMATTLGAAAVMDGVDAVKRRMGKKERLAKLEKRRAYYAAENARRAELREQIRAARPAPKNPCPTPSQLDDAYLHRRDSEEAQRHFGELMIDLEEHAQREFIFSNNRISAASGGVKDWLKAHCPVLAAHYGTCQRYKRLAQAEGQHDSALKVND